MPKDSKNGFYRQEQNIGRLISPPFAWTSSPRIVRRTPWSYTPPVAVRHRGAWLGIPPHCRALSPCAPPVPRCGRARCLAAGPPGSRPVRTARASSFTP